MDFNQFLQSTNIALFLIPLTFHISALIIDISVFVVILSGLGYCSCGSLQLWCCFLILFTVVLDCRGVLLIWTVFISKMKDSIMNSWILLMFFILLSFWNGLMIFTLTFALLLCFWLFMLLFYLICLQTLFNISADFHFSVQ